MQVREKTKPDNKINSSKFNIHALNEVICYWEEGDADSMYIEDLDVFITANNIGWKDMQQAFKDHDIIIDNFNSRFFEPPTEEDRKRGYTLY